MKKGNQRLKPDYLLWLLCILFSALMIAILSVIVYVILNALGVANISILMLRFVVGVTIGLIVGFIIGKIIDWGSTWKYGI